MNKRDTKTSFRKRAGQFASVEEGIVLLTDISANPLFIPKVVNHALRRLIAMSPTLEEFGQISKAFSHWFDIHGPIEGYGFFEMPPFSLKVIGRFNRLWEKKSLQAVKKAPNFSSLIELYPLLESHAKIVADRKLVRLAKTQQQVRLWTLFLNEKPEHYRASEFVRKAIERRATKP